MHLSTHENELHPDVSHPILQIVSGVLQHVDGRYVLDDEGAELLAYALIKHATDPALPEALLTLLALAASWGKTPHQRAGVRILEVVAIVRPKLTILNQSSAPTKAIRKLLDQTPTGATAPQSTDGSHGVARFRAGQDRKRRRRTTR